jgi:hypothetical protein
MDDRCYKAGQEAGGFPDCESAKGTQVALRSPAAVLSAALPAHDPRPGRLVRRSNLVVAPPADGCLHDSALNRLPGPAEGVAVCPLGIGPLDAI